MQGENVLTKQKDRALWEMTEAGKDCQRCLRGGAARYRVYSDALDMKVCVLCAEEARELGISVEPLGFGKKRTDRDNPCRERR